MNCARLATLHKRSKDWLSAIEDSSNKELGNRMRLKVLEFQKLLMSMEGQTQPTDEINNQIEAISRELNTLHELLRLTHTPRLVKQLPTKLV